MIFLKTQRSKKDSVMTNNPEYHFLISLLPYFEPLEALGKLQLRTNIQNLVLDANKKKGRFYKEPHLITLDQMIISFQFNTLIYPSQIRSYGLYTEFR